jgi:uncharacterized membrane protein YfcA
MQFTKLVLFLLLCLVIGALGGAYVVDSLDGEPVLGAVLGSLGGIAFALLAAGGTPEKWVLPPHEEENAGSI